MSNNHHTPLAFGGPLTQAAMEAPIGQLDAAIATVIAASSGTSTSLTAQANSGQASLTVASSAGFQVGDPIYIGTGTTFESRIIATVPGGGVTITVTVNLTNTYAIGKPVSKSSAEIVDARGTMQTLGARLASMEFATNAKYYGAVADGVTDDSTEIQAAIAAVSAAGGGTVFLPAGSYKITSALTIPGDDVSIVGAGRGATIIIWTGSGAAILNSNTANIRRQFHLADLTITNSGAAASSGGVKLENFYNAVIERVEFTSPGTSGIQLEFVGTGSTYYNIVRDCFFNVSTAGATGVKWTNGAANPNANSLIASVVSTAASTTGVNIAGGDTALVLGCWISGATSNTILVIGASGTYARVIGCRFEAGVVTITGTDCRLIGNTHATTAEPAITGARTRSIADGSVARCWLINSAVQSIPNNTATQLTFDTETNDEWNLHTGSSGDITIPAGGIAHNGLYRVRVATTWAANATGIRQLHFYKNGASLKQAVVPSAASASDRLTQTVIWEGALVAGDVVAAFAYQNSGGALDAGGATETIRSTLTIERIV